MMVVGTTLLKLDGAPYYSPSFPRGGLAAVFAVDVTHFSGPSSLAIGVEHRDENDTSWTSAGSFSAITGTGVVTHAVTGLKQIVRLKYEITATNAYDGIHFVMQAPTWRPYA